MSIGVIVESPALSTYAVEPSRVKTTPAGQLPTEIVLPIRQGAPVTTDTELFCGHCVFMTYTV